jgi:hypothetical protein
MLAALSWDPAIQGILTVAIAVVLLMGSVYLLLATNTGARLGLLIALAALFGWCAILGFVWTIYGKGVADQGRAPEWKVIEVNTGDLNQAATDEVAEDPDLSTWTELPAGDPARGEAQAAAEAAIAGEEPGKPFATTSDFLVVDAFEKGGETYFATFRHRPHFAVMQVQAVIPQETVPGQAPPTPEADEDAPVISVVMERDLGNKRFRPAAFTFLSLVLFGICANALHRRDKLAAEARSKATTG